jgi:hypothetical protein
MVQLVFGASPMNFEVFADVNYADPLIKRNNLVIDIQLAMS